MRAGDRVATLAWNTQAHVEVVVRHHGHGRGLPHAQSAPDLRAARGHGRAVAARACWSSARTSLPLARADRRGRAVDRAAAGHRCARRTPRRCRRGSSVCALEPLIAQARGDVRLGRLRRDHALRPVLHLGHHGRAQGRDLHASLELPAHAARAAGRRHGHQRARQRAGRGADVSRQCLGPAVRRAGRRREAGAARPAHSTARSLAALINAEGVTVGVGIATVWLDLVEHLERSGGDVPTLERIIVGGAPLPPALMERIEQRLGVHRADQLGHDRAVALGHGGAARCAVALGASVGPARASASICCSPTPTAAPLPRAARRRRTPARARRGGDRALLRRGAAAPPMPTAGCPRAIWRASTPTAISSSPAAPRT